MREIVRGSIECKWRQKQIKVWIGVLCGTIGALFLMCLFAGAQPGTDGKSDMKTAFEIFGILTASFTVIFLPFVFYYVWQYLKLFRHCESYELYEVMLDKPDTSVFYRGAIYYRVSFVTEQDEYITLDTKPLWSGSGSSDLQLEKYNNRKVRVLYDRENVRVIVVG